MNLTVSEWEEKSDGGSLMIQQRGAVLEVGCLLVCKERSESSVQHILFMSYDL